MSPPRSPSPSSQGRSHSQDTEQFLLAAKRSEIVTLQTLVNSCQLVTAVSALIHELQRERGISNIYLASGGARFGEERREQVNSGGACEQELRKLLREHYLDGGPASGNMRLFNSIAFVLQGLNDLPALRRRIEAQGIDAIDTTRALSRLIAGLLSVVFEAADSAGDPAVTRFLVALFNLMQGKEYAGQERAWGAIGFAAGGFDEALCERLAHLQEAQQRSFALFVEFAPPAFQTRWQAIEATDRMRDLNRLRRMISRLGQGEVISAQISEVWYDLATQRIDRMKGVEDDLAAALLELSEQQVQRARQDLKAHQQRLTALATVEIPAVSPLTLLYDPPAPAGAAAGKGEGADGGAAQGLGPELARSVYDLVRGQAEHLKQISEELEEARRALTERKRIERAKGLLMQSLGLTEEQAYRRMQRRAMELNTRLADVADTLIRAADRAREGSGTT